MRIKQLILLILFYSLPLFSYEIYFQITQRHQLNGDEYLYPFFSWTDNNSIFSNGLNRPNIKRENPHQFLFDYDENTPIRYSKFQTDRYGTIKPSDLESALKESKGDLEKFFDIGITLIHREVSWCHSQKYQRLLLLFLFYFG